ncbi:DUF4367 domain-containing protein [Paenibacillus glucanolyticus]|uniref:DUF4367 domain-containing protein n=1 Tax=Paenibacillus glucanolyticus TaxID=59843 RepID=UPI00128C8B0A|nr:DUF4367 domain-containing protein [Paenibacillus glucanolyticus]MPY20060.1 DUF4367 domain-containing protein [Paenibacillus glucanolyticus]
MKKQVAIVALSSLLVLGGGGFAYYSYAAGVEQEVQNPTIETSQPTEQNIESSIVDDSVSTGQETIEIKPETTVGPGVPPEGLVDITDIPAADIHIPLPEDKLSLQSSELTQNNFQAMQREYGLHLRSLFTTADGDQIRVSQTDARKEVSAVIESLKNDYSLETVELTEINGFTTLYVDGEFRKVVHLISNDHLFTIASSTATLDQLMDIAKQIHE